MLVIKNFISLKKKFKNFNILWLFKSRIFFGKRFFLQKKKKINLFRFLTSFYFLINLINRGKIKVFKVRKGIQKVRRLQKTYLYFYRLCLKYLKYLNLNWKNLNICKRYFYNQFKKDSSYYLFLFNKIYILDYFSINSKFYSYFNKHLLLRVSSKGVVSKTFLYRRFVKYLKFMAYVKSLKEKLRMYTKVYKFICFKPSKFNRKRKYFWKKRRKYISKNRFEGKYLGIFVNNFKLERNLPAKFKFKQPWRLRKRNVDFTGLNRKFKFKSSFNRKQLKFFFRSKFLQYKRLLQFQWYYYFEGIIYDGLFFVYFFTFMYFFLLNTIRYFKFISIVDFCWFIGLNYLYVIVFYLKVLLLDYFHLLLLDFLLLNYFVLFYLYFKCKKKISSYFWFIWAYLFRSYKYIMFRKSRRRKVRRKYRSRYRRSFSTRLGKYFGKFMLETNRFFNKKLSFCFGKSFLKKQKFSNKYKNKLYFFKKI